MKFFIFIFLITKLILTNEGSKVKSEELKKELSNTSLEKIKEIHKEPIKVVPKKKKIIEKPNVLIPFEIINSL